nr:MAG TPA: hypothetical protein [Bacteriophage sp.]
MQELKKQCFSKNKDNCRVLIRCFMIHLVLISKELM